MQIATFKITKYHFGIFDNPIIRLEYGRTFCPNGTESETYTDWYRSIPYILYYTVAL